MGMRKAWLGARLSLNRFGDARRDGKAACREVTALVVLAFAAGCASSSSLAPDAGQDSGEAGWAKDSSAPDGNLPGQSDAKSDAKSFDAGGDAHGAKEGGLHGPDAGSDSASPALCDGSICYAGESCVGGQCTITTCVGDNVPGDYATVQDAVNALTAGGTICLAAQAYDETVLAAPTSGLITIQGAGRGQSVLTGFGTSGTLQEGVAYDYALNGLTLGGLNIDAEYVGTTATVTVTDAVIAATGANSAVRVIAFATGPTLTLNGVDISAASTEPAIYASVNPDTSGLATTLNVANCYIHGAQSGLVIDGFEEIATLNVINNTFVGDGTAINLVVESTGTVTASLFNNLLVDNGVAIALTYAADVGNNALYGNTTNYGGVATDGSDYVKKNPLLDTSTPPGLLPGSPCRGAADATQAPANDFYGRARGASPDIGAVQSSP
jgi:hypothetical protein